MSIIPSNEFTGKILPPSTEYPYGKAKNVSSPGAADGTPLVANLLNDIFGFQQFLLDKAGIVPNGTPDTAVNSQYFQALWKIINMMSITINLTVDADYTLTATENLYKNITITDSGNLLTISRNIIVDNVGKFFIVTNSTSYDLTIKTSSGTGVIVVANTSLNLVNNGVDVTIFNKEATETFKGIAKIATNAIVDNINNTSNNSDIMTPDKTRRMITNESLGSLYTLASPVQIFSNQNSLNGSNFNVSINIDLTNINGVDYSNKKYLFLNMFCMANRKSGTGASNTFNLTANNLGSGFVVINSSSAIETNSIANTMQIVPVNGNTLTITRSRTGGTLVCEYYMSITLTGYFD